MWKLDKISKNDVTIVLPTLNEEKAIGLVIDELRKAGYNNIIVVDGYSSDKTVEIARSKGVKVIFQKGKGKNKAIKTAVKYVKTPYIVVMDADYTYPAKYIDKLIELAEEYDEIIGARIYGRKNIPLLNRFGNKILDITFNLLFGTNLKDVCSGMYLIKTNMARSINYEMSGFSLEVELAAHVASTTNKITDIPIKYRKRKGKPKLSKKHGFTILKDIIRLTWRYNPTFFIMIMGSIIIIPALIILSWVAIELIFFGIKHHVWAILGSTMATAGITSLTLAILSLYLKRMEYRIMQKITQKTML